ncbi:MAG: type II toxin-antitoxin system PemK/MazF family toxin [Thermoanaerobaculaceae bacterium]|jgi:mRNA interferase MazF
MRADLRPKRGEVWVVDFNPTRGAELYKERPAVVVSSDGVGVLPVKLVVPLTEWQDKFASNIWHVRVEAPAGSGLDKVSAADAMQVVCASIERFKRRLGYLPADLMDEIAAAIAAVIEFQ